MVPLPTEQSSFLSFPEASVPTLLSRPQPHASGALSQSPGVPAAHGLPAPEARRIPGSPSPTASLGPSSASRRRLLAEREMPDPAPELQTTARRLAWEAHGGRMSNVPKSREGAYVGEEVAGEA